jgi:YesN/AraC family two-component response regulator
MEYIERRLGGDMKNLKKYLINFAEKCKNLKYEQVILGREQHPSRINKVYGSPDEKSSYIHYYTQELAICTGGKCVMNIENRDYILSPGSVCVTNINKPHFELNYEKNTGYEIIWISAERKNALEIKNKIYDPDTGYKVTAHLEIRTDNPKEINPFFRKIFKAADKNFEAIKNNICSILKLVKIKLEKNDYKIIDTAIKPKYDMKLNKDRFEKVKEYIRKHYTENVSMKDVAGEVWLHPVYCNSLFKNTYNYSVKQNIIGMRLSKAIELMKETQLTISEISYKVGYDDPHFFSRIFRKHEGVTPTAYRKEFLNK